MIRAALISALAVASPALANGDVAMGEELFVICSGCHQVGPDATNRLGPHLNGLVGREIGSVEDYHYSPTLRDMTDAWTVEDLDRFLTDPTAFAYGTYMIIDGIADANERASLIAFIVETGADATVGGPDPEVEAVLAYEPDEAYGAYLSSECTTCHRAGGEDIPNINGLAPANFVSGLIAYRNGAREHQVMTMIAGRLGDEEIAALAAYFATAD